MPDAAAQRDFALDIVRRLRAAGHAALWAGGCVRDQLLGQEPKDYDVATSATPDQIRALFGRRRTIAVGAAFGVITVLGPRDAGQIEVATFRTDAAYSDGRHPDAVRFTNAQEDAARRDFTINGLFFDPIANEIVDYVGGQDDLRSRLIRAIGDPRLRLGEDKLRMLRAVRFAATFDFAIEDATLRAVQAMAGDILTVSAERIGMEIRRMLVDPNRAPALELLRESGLLPHVLPEVAALDDAAFDETKRVLAALREPTLPLALAALLVQERGRESFATGDGEGDGSLLRLETLPAEESNQSQKRPDPVRGVAKDVRPPRSPIAHTIARRLRYTNKEADRAAWLLEQLPTIDEAQQVPWPRLQRVLIHEGAAELLALREAIAGPDDDALAFARERLAWPPERLNPSPLVDGSDLIAHGIAPGPQFTPLLEQLRDAQLEGRIHTREEALALADRLRGENQSLP